MIVFDAKEAPDLGSREDLVEGVRVRYADQGHRSGRPHRAPHRGAPLSALSAGHLQRPPDPEGGPPPARQVPRQPQEFLDELDERQHRRPRRSRRGPHHHPKSTKTSGRAPPRPALRLGRAGHRPSASPRRRMSTSGSRNSATSKSNNSANPNLPRRTADKEWKADRQGEARDAGGNQSATLSAPARSPDAGRRAERGPPIDPVLNDPAFWQQRINELKDD